MKTILLMSMYSSFNYENNMFKNVFLKDFNCVADKNDPDIDIIFAGSFIDEKDKEYIISKKCYKILYISEPIQHHYKIPYLLYIKNEFDMCFGCIFNDPIKHCVKFPLYANYILGNNNVFNNLNNSYKIDNLNNKNFCALICRHDTWNTRTTIYNSLIKIDNITCPSRLFNNYSNEELNKVGKENFLKNYIFNICPENTYTDLKGYITEKVMDACMSGCIPIYLEDVMDDIDKKIFNIKRIIFYKNNQESINNTKIFIEKLYKNKKDLLEFYNQDIFLPGAYEEIQNMNNNLINNLKKIN
jgi:hypothetical protein